MMKTFKLLRHVDISGISGTGVVAEGAVFSNGYCTLCWLSSFPSINVYTSIDDLLSVHGHKGLTELVWTEDSTDAKN